MRGSVSQRNKHPERIVSPDTIRQRAESAMGETQHAKGFWPDGGVRID